MLTHLHGFDYMLTTTTTDMPDYHNNTTTTTTTLELICLMYKMAQNSLPKAS